VGERCTMGCRPELGYAGKRCVRCRNLPADEPVSRDAATKELIERLRQERDDARRDAAFVREQMATMPTRPASGAAVLATAHQHRVIEPEELPGVLAAIDEARNGPGVAPRPCCRRLGSVWCTRTDVHEESACRGPEERELPVNLLDRGRVR
jgi:hypothetical protein